MSRPEADKFLSTLLREVLLNAFKAGCYANGRCASVARTFVAPRSRLRGHRVYVSAHITVQVPVAAEQGGSQLQAYRKRGHL